MVADLRAESDDLDVLVAELSAETWAANTPAPGWTIAHQIAHLLWTDRVALSAVTDEAGFAAVLEEAAKDPAGFVDAGAEELAVTPARSTAGRLAPDPRSTARRAHGSRRRPQAAVVRSADERRVDGHGPVDGDVGARPRRRRRARREAARDGAAALDRAHRGAHPRLRLRHQRADSPAGPVSRRAACAGRLDLVWGPEDAAQRITGSAEDFCMLVTQRRPHSALDVHAAGDDAERWLTIAQAFAGPPGPGR